MTSKRKTLCVDEKVELIRAIEKGERKSYVARRFGFSPSTVSTIWKNKDKFLQAKKDGKSSKKLKKPKFEDLDRAMLSWFCKQRQNNMPVSGPIIKAKAEQFAEKLNITHFKASEGWLGKFKQRHRINYCKAKVEASIVDTNVNCNWIKNVWPQLKEKYAPDDIFIAEEAEIFYKSMPDITLKFNGEKCVGGTHSKNRVSVLVAANMNGTEKRKLLIIGKLKNPWCFNNIVQLPVTYKSNETAQMTGQLFEEELLRWDAELTGRKILLLVDNCAADPLLSNLQNIELAFFPAIKQPLEQSMVKSLESQYRKKLLMELIESEGRSSINMLHAVNFLSKAWQEVTATTIQHSFLRAGLCNNYESHEPEFEREDDLPLIEMSKQLNVLQNFTENLETFVQVDDNLAIAASLTDKKEFDSVVKIEEDQGDEEDEVDDLEPPPSIEQALHAAKLLENFFLFNGDDPSVTQDMNKIKQKIQLKYWHEKFLLRKYFNWNLNLST